MVAIGGGMVGRKDFPIIFVEVSLDFRNGVKFPTLLYRSSAWPSWSGSGAADWLERSAPGTFLEHLDIFCLLASSLLSGLWHKTHSQRLFYTYMVNAEESTKSPRHEAFQIGGTVCACFPMDMSSMPAKATAIGWPTTFLDTKR